MSRDLHTNVVSPLDLASIGVTRLLHQFRPPCQI
ncbi:unnamed protein product [Ixodes pacificus]